MTDFAPRRFVTCFDGTWNAPDKGANPTNVVKMVRTIRNVDDDGVTQVTFYDKGVGTAGGTDKFVGGGLGVGLTANVVDGYRFFANNYVPGDELYIFGFSSGAYTARSLAGLIGIAGLLDPTELGESMTKVKDIYRDPDVEPADKRAARAGRCPSSIGMETPSSLPRTPRGQAPGPKLPETPTCRRQKTLRRPARGFRSCAPPAPGSPCSCSPISGSWCLPRPATSSPRWSSCR